MAILQSHKQGTGPLKDALSREKDLKKWRRDWKVRLIEEQNLAWDDLYPPAVE
jgi:predicted GIY-YIG superfamily endonuclease